MRFRKVIAGIAASTIAATAVTAAASAELVPVDAVKGANGLDIFVSSENSWMPIAYSNGEKDSKQKDVIDYGVDWSKAAAIEVTISIEEPDEWDGDWGGGLILSSQADGNSTHNWNAKLFWGVNDEDLGLEAADQDFQFNKIGDYTYKGVMEIDEDNFVIDNPQLVQICFADYKGVTWFYVKVEKMAVVDASGNELISWNSAGQASLAPVGAAVDAAPAEAAPAEAAPAEAAPAAADTTEAVTSTKGSPDTGVADVAAVAGIAVVAAGALVVAKKRK